MTRKVITFWDITRSAAVRDTRISRSSPTRNDGLFDALVWGVAGLEALAIIAVQP